jgi:hypothetical protein
MNTEIIPYKEPRSVAGLAARPPALFLPNEKATGRFYDFFTGNICNRNTRRAYYKAAARLTICRPYDHTVSPTLPGNDYIDIT